MRVDFSGISDYCYSFGIPKYKIKPPSKFLPVDNVLTKKDAFHMGAREGSGSAMFYKIIPKIKEIIGKLPKSKKGKLVNMIDLTRNEARNLNANINTLINILLENDTKETDCKKIEMDCKKMEMEMERNKMEMDNNFESLFLLEKCYDELRVMLDNLKIYNGLLKGNATIGILGNIVAGKESLHDIHHYLKAKNNERKVELDLLEEVYDKKKEMFEKIWEALNKKGVGLQEFTLWKCGNKRQFETKMNNLKAGGNVLGVGLQGLVTTGINFGIAAATLNPAAFAAGTYYAISTFAKIGTIIVKTRIENDIIRENVKRYAQLQYKKIAGDTEQEKKISNNLTLELTYYVAQHNLSRIQSVETFQKVHIIIDGLSNTAFGAAATIFVLPISTGKPATLTPHSEKIHRRIV